MKKNTDNEINLELYGNSDLLNNPIVKREIECVESNETKKTFALIMEEFLKLYSKTCDVKKINLKWENDKFEYLDILYNTSSLN